jgi:hypothetical protein
LMVYPDSRHGVQASQRKHSSREAHDFWVRTLLHGKLPAPPPVTAPRAAPAASTNPDGAASAR